MNIKFGEIENKIPNTSGLVTTTVVDTKIEEVWNKIPAEAKVLDIEGKYFTTFDYNKFVNNILDAKTRKRNS